LDYSGAIKSFQEILARFPLRYQQFLEIWKDADADLPQVLNARARLTEGQISSLSKIVTTQ